MERVFKRKIDLEKGKLLYYQYFGSKFDIWHELGNEYENCHVPQEIEDTWKNDILSKLENEILTAQGENLMVAVGRYMDLSSADSEYLIRILQSKEIDTFTCIIFCEKLKNILRHTKDKEKVASIRRSLDEMKVKLLSEPITIHESYKNAEYMSDYDFSDTNIRARIEAI